MNKLAAGAPTEDACSITLITKPDLKELVRSAWPVDDEGAKTFWWKEWWDIKARSFRQLTPGPVKKWEYVPENGEKDIWMFSVFDGHSGPHISRLLSKTLHGCLAWNLGKACLGLNGDAECSSSSGERDGFTDGLASWAEGGSPVFGSSLFGSASCSITKIIQETFLALDKDIVQAPYLLMKDPASIPLSLSPWLPPHAPSNLALGALIYNGSCALTAIIDVEADTLYVANVGDPRAVAGWYNPSTKEWRCDILTDDQMGDNPKEIERIRSEHPDEEREAVVLDRGNGDGCRIFGGLQPTRAFGDGDFKLPHEEWLDLRRGVKQEEPGKRWAWLEECPVKTPPYVTAKPEVTCRRLHPENGEQLKFLLLATDGLFDRLTSEEASHLLAARDSHRLHPDIPKVDLLKLFPHKEEEGEHPFPTEDMSTTGSWVFEDEENSATHLIRNGLGGGDRTLRRQFLSMRQPGVRQVRDDITAVVIWFDEPQPQTPSAENGELLQAGTDLAPKPEWLQSYAYSV